MIINDGFEYKMSETMAKAILSVRKGEEKKKHPKEYLIDYVNEQMGIKGVCTGVKYF